MGIEGYRYGGIRVNGEEIGLAVCSSCHQIIAMAEEELSEIRDEGENVLVYLDKHATCCDRPDYFWRKPILPFPPPRK